MAVNKHELLGILNIGHDTSIRGGGLSLKAAIAQTGYERLRKEFGPPDFVPLLRANPELIDQWQMWCEDKRTSAGYWLSAAACEIGKGQSESSRYGSAEEAVAAYVVAELDFWAQVGTDEAARGG